jgi:hypothetical protein
MCPMGDELVANRTVWVWHGRQERRGLERWTTLAVYVQYLAWGYTRLGGVEWASAKWVA